MSKFLKISCCVYWLVWMLALSLLFGVSHVLEKFTFLGEHSYIARILMYTCIFVSVLALVGCCCVKCDISHIICNCLYIVPGLVIALSLNIFIIVYLQVKGPKLILSQTQLIAKVRKFMNEHKALPVFLQYTQFYQRCCGIYGFKDYRAFLLKKDIMQDIPDSCCHHTGNDFHDECVSINQNMRNDPNPLFDIYLNLDSSEGYQFPVKTPTEKIVKQLYGSVPTENSDPQIYLNSTLLLPVNTTKAMYFNLNGCYDELRNESETILDHFLYFAIFLSVASIAMIIMHIQNCLKVRRLQLEAANNLTSTDDVSIQEGVAE